MITEDYVSFETAKLLKEKGFDEVTAFVYSDKGELLRLSEFGTRDLTNKDCDGYSKWQFPIEDVSSIISAPTLQMATKWLRKVHNLHIMVDCIGAENYIPTIQFTRNSKDIEIKSKISKIGGNGFDSNEQAIDASIKYCLENLI